MIPIATTYNANPVYQDPCNYTTMEYGVIGFSLTGVPFYSPLSLNSVDPFYPPSATELESVDMCLAHPQNAGAYHYHLASPCMLGTNKQSQPIGNTFCYGKLSGTCKNMYNGTSNFAFAKCTSDCITGVGFPNNSMNSIIGIMLDGNFMYGPWDAKGSAVTGTSSIYLVLFICLMVRIG